MTRMGKTAGYGNYVAQTHAQRLGQRDAAAVATGWALVAAVGGCVAGASGFAGGWAIGVVGWVATVLFGATAWWMSGTLRRNPVLLPRGAPVRPPHLLRSTLTILAVLLALLAVAFALIAPQLDAAGRLVLAACLGGAGAVIATGMLPTVLRLRRKEQLLADALRARPDLRAAFDEVRRRHDGPR